MVICSSIKACARLVLNLRGQFHKQMRSHICNLALPSPRSSCLALRRGNSTTAYYPISVSNRSSFLTVCGHRAFQRIQHRLGISSKRGYSPSLTVKSSVSRKGSQETLINISDGYQSASVKILVPKKRLFSNFRSYVGPFTFLKGSITAGLISGLLVCYSSYDSVHAEASEDKGKNEESADPPSVFSHGKKVYTDYSVIGIPGDGRCLFRSVAHGACLRSGKPAPGEKLQKEFADDLRAKVADEFIRRRQETEWFIEGDFDTYISQIRKPHVWGGEPELLMLSHVLRMPITVYMRDDKHGGLISIAEYGQEYGKDNPVRVLYHGYGHYDALLIPGKKGAKSRL